MVIGTATALDSFNHFDLLTLTNFLKTKPHFPIDTLHSSEKHLVIVFLVPLAV